MKRLALVAGLACLGTALTVVPGFQATATAPARSPAPAAPSLVSQMKAQASGATKFSLEKATGSLDFIRTGAGQDLLPGVAASGVSAVGRKADAYLAKYSQAFGAARGELHRTGVAENDFGFTVRYEQRYEGVPVFGSRLLANFDEAGRLRAVNGYAAPGLELSTSPRLTRAQAAEVAVAQVRHDPPTSAKGAPADLSGIKAVDTELVIYRTGVTRGVDGVNTLAYAVRVTNEANVNDMVILRADSPKVLNRWSSVAQALDRMLITCDGVDEDDNCIPELVWEEGDPTDPLDRDQRNLLDSAKETYWLFRNAFGRDSFDGEGGTMISLHNRTDECPNASWNGIYTSYCPGFYSDDVVAHEWGHAYTEYTSDLIYQWQSGALNESYSDVWGETLDLINEREDEGESENLLDKRPDGQCSAHMRAAIEVTITAPASIAGPCSGAAPASFGLRFTHDPTEADIVPVTDADNDGAGGDGTTGDGCSAFDEGQATDGTWAYVDRGACAIEEKARHAKDAGYEGIVVGNNVPEAPFSASGNIEGIYGLMVSQVDGAAIKQEGGASISVVETVDERTETYRWLIGEKSPGAGVPSRDMWNPTCAGHAGKVSDAEYSCGFDDGGGVHSNSGVPNHTYALAVDGGSYNGQTIEGIGLDKAAAIWWRAQSQYLTPVSDFPDLGNALAASCADLVGEQVRELSVQPEALEVLSEPVTSLDCAELGEAIVATELSDDAIERCDYQALLDPDAPSACGAGFTTTTVWSEDFEEGLAGWDTDREIVFEGGIAAAWEPTTDAPDNHAGVVAYGPMPHIGKCTYRGDEPGDFSSRDSIISPEVTVPASGHRPLLSFDHSVVTEQLFDGGSLAYSLNGREFTPVPPTAYLHNPPTVDKLPQQVDDWPNTNPLVGLPVWTGTDEGTNKPGWGQSQVSLNDLGAVSGDRLRFRFDAGRDGCAGLGGWYVDNVAVTVCEPKGQAPSTATPTSTPTTTPTTTPGTTPTAPPGPEATTVKVTKPANPPRHKADFRVKVVVKAAGLTPTGQVVVKHAGVVIGKGRLVDGKVRITIRKNLAVGGHQLLARYQGSSVAEPSQRRFTIRVVRA